MNKARDAKLQTEIGEEKEILDLATIQASSENKYGKIEEERLQNALDNLAGDGKTTVSAKDDFFEVEFTESKRKYKVDKNGNIIEDTDEVPEVADKYPGDITDNSENDGTIDNPYKIYCVEDFIAFVKESREGNSFEGKYIEVKNSLDFASTNSYVDPNNTTYGDFNQNGETEPLIKELTTGRGLRNIKQFKGVLDGKNNTLYNFYMQDEIYYDPETGREDYSIGLVQINKGTIKNLNLRGILKCDIGENIVHGYIGSIVGENYDGGNVENCNSSVDIDLGTPILLRSVSSTEILVGGIVGYNKEEGKDTIINKCIYNGTIKGEFDIRSGNSYGDTMRIGGITGENETKIINCINKGTINIKKEYIEETSLTSKLSIGGITAKNNDNGVIENSMNTGSIQGEAIGTEIIIGGISSETEDLSTSIITNVFNSGKISGKASNIAEVGGILGEGYGILNYGYNIGTIDGTSDTEVRKGAIIGNYKESTQQTNISNCIYDKIAGIFGAEGNDVEGIEYKENFSQSEAIEILNNNINAHNMQSDKDYEWYKFKDENGNVSF